MIVVYGRSDDPPIARLTERLRDIDARYTMLELSALEFEEIQIELGPSGVTGRFSASGELRALDDVRAVYARPLGLPVTGTTPGAGERVMRFHRAFIEWLDVASGEIVSRPSAMQANASKPYQAQLIGEAGFRVPETLVSNDERDVTAFWRAHGRVVYKSVSGVRSIVRELDDQALARFERLVALPTQFQAYVAGVDIRVHVVGEKTFAAAIESAATDYRYAGRTGAEAKLSVTEIPPQVGARCVELSRAMDLPLSGIDLRRCPDGDFVCFEVNPMPAYSYYEAHTGLPISAALADLLVAANRSSGEVSHGPRH